MDFAKKILDKYGWKEGEGLGKHSDGITKPLKASLKFDTSGFGADQAASDFNNHWWERVFNEAARNVDIKADKNGEVKLKRKNADEVEISTKSYSMQKLKKAKSVNQSAEAYDNFIPSATLTNAGNEIENDHKIVSEDIAVTTFKALTDEELFAACGGRTAHKGARHGLKLSGKLARLEQQEKELLAKMLNKQSEKQDEEIITVKTKKSKKLKSFSENQERLEQNTEIKTEKALKKKQKNIEDNQTHQSEELGRSHDANIKVKKSKKKSKKKEKQ